MRADETPSLALARRGVDRTPSLALAKRGVDETPSLTLARRFTARDQMRRFAWSRFSCDVDRTMPSYSTSASD